MSSPEGAVPGAAEHEHPTPRKYVFIAIVLGLVTAIEVAVYYIPPVRDRAYIFIPALLAFALIKFSLVAQWFMHLKFDSRIFRWLFVAGIILALSVFAVVLVTFFLAGVDPVGGRGA